MKRYIPKSRLQPKAPSRAPIDIVKSLQDPLLLGAALGSSTSWARWLSILKAAFCLDMSAADLTAFREVAGDRDPPRQRVRELWCVLGRRSGKTRMASAIAVYTAAIEQHQLASGEVGYVLLIAASRDQASVAYKYVVGFLKASPLLRQQIVSETASEIRLKGNIVISVHANSFRTVRGRTLLAVVGDETSFWRDESTATPDTEVFRAVTPALAASKGLWVAISTGYRRQGLLYSKWKEHFGQSTDDILVVQGASTQFNPTLDQQMIAAAQQSDPEAAEAEWSGGFRSDIAAFLDDEVIEKVIDYSRPLEIPPRSGIQYAAFVDPSGGRHDAFCICIAHKEGSGDGAFHVCDVLRGRYPPFDPASVVKEYAALLKEYRIHTVTGDNYSAEWASAAFNKAGIKYVRSEMNKSELYIEALPLFMRSAISIPNHPKLLRELRLLERRTSRMGRDVVDHGANGSDDHCNALAGCLRCLARSVDISMAWVNSDIEDENQDGKETYRARLLKDYLFRAGIPI